MKKHFSELFKETKTIEEKRWLSKIVLLMLTLRQQKVLRNKIETEKVYKKAVH